MSEHRAATPDGKSTVEQAQSSIAAIWDRVRPTVLEGVAVIEEAVVALLEGRLGEEERAAAERAAHKIAGSAGTFGFHRATGLARDLEALFAVGTEHDEQAGALGADNVDALRRELAARIPSPTNAPAEHGARLLVVRPADELSERIGSTAIAHGLQHRSADDLATARHAIQSAPPDVVLLDLSHLAGDGLTLLTELDAMTPRVPVLVQVGDGGFVDRVEAARAGATAFLPTALSPGRMVEAAVGGLERTKQVAGRLLAVDDDPALLAILEELFRDHALELTTLSDPSRFWDVLEETAPDLVLLDLDMPDVGGLELCRLVRADAHWETLPVLVLTASTAADSLHDVFAAGADDFVAKPVVGPELLTRVLNRLERVRLYRQLAETDPLTGLPNRRKFAMDVRRLRAMASRYDQPLSFALLNLDRFKRVNDQHGHTTGDALLQRLAELLARSFRTEDVVARWSGEELAIAMYGMRRDDGVARVAAMLEAFREETFATADGPLNATFSAGVAQFGVDGDELHQLYRRADEACAQAKAIGGDRVLPAGWSPGADDGLMDVIIVEDDPVLASLLTH
ncbi:MAG TPA: diguanylate cyclase, partial [Nocardioides sp.]|nr:diguanylate cyclase [Nocardioides sp.]